jgi:large subunit ribosomal protein L25
MEKVLVLEAELRPHAGRKAATDVRRAGRIPAVVYGHKQQPVSISLDAHALVEGLHHGHRLMDVKIGGETGKMIVKDLQYDHLGKNIIHVDMMRVDITETVRVQVPVEFKGTAKGTHEGGIFEGHVDHIEVSCKVTDIPETVVVWVKELGVGQTMHAGDIELPAGVKLVSDESLLIASCHMLAVAKTTEQVETEAPAEPEVIGEQKEGEPGEGRKEQPEQKSAGK